MNTLQCAVLSAAILENDIRDACSKAIAAQSRDSIDFGELSSILSALTDCARRAKAIGKESWEIELLDMIAIINWRCSACRADVA
jgi:hypothetical protein